MTNAYIRIGTTIIVVSYITVRVIVSLILRLATVNQPFFILNARWRSIHFLLLLRPWPQLFFFLIHAALRKDVNLLIAADLARNVTLGPVAQWITRLTTNQEIAGSTPARVEIFFFIEMDFSRNIIPYVIQQELQRNALKAL